MFDRLRRFVRRDPDPDPDDLFDIQTLCSDATDKFESSDRAGIMLRSAGDKGIEDVDAVRSVLTVDTDCPYEVVEDEFGSIWVRFDGESIEAVATSVRTIAEALWESHFDDEYVLLAAFAVTLTELNDEPLYWVYVFEHGYWYPSFPDECSWRLYYHEDAIKDWGGAHLDIDPDESRHYRIEGVPL